MTGYINNSATISIRGAPKGTLRAYRSAIRWCLGKLLGKRLADVTTVDVFFIKNLNVKEFVYGDCELDDDNFPPRLFKIRIDHGQEITRFQQFKTIFHELVHLKQFSKGELYDYQKQENITRWKRKKIDIIKTDYENLPWEKEAYKLQNELIREWAKETNYYKFIHKRNDI